MNSNKIDLGKLTGGDVTGSGVYDELMRTVSAHVQSQYDAGRITDVNFSSVYLGALQSCLSEANQFLLNYEITNQKIRLLDAQILNEQLNGTLIQAQINKTNKDTDYLNKQILKVDDEIALVKAQVQVQLKQLEVMDKAVLNASKDIEVKDSGITLQTAQTVLANQSVTNAIAQEAQIQKQTLKLQSEIDVLNQRKLSELAQTSDTINGQPIRGLLGKQVELYSNQAQGYLRDAEQKAAKILNDTFLTRITTEYDSADATTAGQSDAEVQKVMAKLKAGIGVV